MKIARLVSISLIGILAFSTLGVSADDKSAVVSFSNLGLEITVPKPYEANTMRMGYAEVTLFATNGVGLAVGNVQLPPGSSAQKIMASLSKKGGGGTIKTSQGVVFGSMKLDVPYKGHGMIGMPLENRIMAGASSSHIFLAFAGLPGNSLQMLVIVGLAPASKAGEVDSVCQAAISSIQFGSSTPGAIAYTSASSMVAGSGTFGSGFTGFLTKKFITLPKGQMGLVGKIDSINGDNTSMVLVVDTVLTSGQEPTKLDPVRPKVIIIRPDFEKFELGARVCVVGFSQGAGKPMKAEKIEPVDQGVSLQAQ